MAEAIDPTAEDAYWRQNHASQSYADDDFTYDDDYAPAYRYGYNSYSQRGGVWDDSESDL